MLDRLEWIDIGLGLRFWAFSWRRTVASKARLGSLKSCGQPLRMSFTFGKKWKFLRLVAKIMTSKHIKCIPIIEMFHLRNT